MTALNQKQVRALFYVFDAGTGVGHLRRLAGIARNLQGLFSCLLITGHRAAANWFVPANCEYVHVPSWDSLIEKKASYWGRKPFISVDECEAIAMRKQMIEGVVASFKPDVIFVDHLPLGAKEELADVIKYEPCLKFFVTRGILNETEDLGRLILGGRAQEALTTYYHRILVASDQRVFDFSKQYNCSDILRAKTIHTGYVIDQICQSEIVQVRSERGLEANKMWVVASAGSGQLGEPLMRECMRLATEYKEIEFDIILGPRSAVPWVDRFRTSMKIGNVRLHKETPMAQYLHASANLVISTGGYNSLLESLQGQANILCFPYRRDHRDEQYRHALCLQKFVNISVTSEISELPSLLANALDVNARSGSMDRRSEINMAGATAIKDILLRELAIAR